MSCPNCGENDVQMTGQKKSNQGFEEETYSCPTCECEWMWTMERTILQEGKYEDDE